ncbi:MAG TPA: SLC13 family permease [Bryobacteraceae bacterium]|nr:SLC13 family permease [Bryobacteraceae bacterium]
MASERELARPAPPRVPNRDREGAALSSLYDPNIWKVVPVLAIPVALWFLPLHLESQAQHAIAIALFMILAWATEVMDHGLTGLIGCYLFWALGVVKFEVAFSGFADDTPWFLMGAILFGTMASKSGLAKRLAYLVTIRIGTSYSRLLLAIILSDFLLTFLVPSGMARVTIMAAVASGLIGAFGLGPGSNVGRGMFLILTYTAGVFDKTIIAGAAAITGRGIIESAGHVEVLWSQWLVAYLPSDIVTILVAWRLTLWLYPPEIASLPGGIEHLKDELRRAGPWTPLEKKSLALMLMAIVFWATDFLHHIPSSMIGLGIGLLGVLPFMGILAIEDVKKLNFLQLFFVAAAVSMGKVLSASNGLAVLTNVVFSWLTPLLTQPLLSTFALYWTGFVYHLFLASEISMLGTSMPLLMQFATAHGLSPLKLGMLWVFSSGGKIFVYQSGVLVIGYAYGYFRAKDILRLGLIMSLVDSLLLLVVVPLYWPLIGIK